MSALLPLLIMGRAVIGQRGGSAGDLTGYYNRNREVTFSGTVTGKTKGQAPGYAQGVSILIRTGKTIREVELGPAWFVGRQSSAINLGDKVKVTGVPVVIDKRERVTIARQVVRGNSVLALLDPTGNPLWSARRSGRVAMGNDSMKDMGTMYRGTISGTKRYTVNGEQYSGYVLNTANGPVDVAVAPSWYWDNQPASLNVGDNVTLYGTGTPEKIGGGGLAGRGGIVLLNSAAYGDDNNTLFLSSGGFRVYGGFHHL